MAPETVLRNLRLARGEKLEDTAKAVGLSRSGYHGIEIGTRSAKPAVARRIAKHFGEAFDGIFLPSSYSVREIGGEQAHG